MNIVDIARTCHEVNRIYCATLGDTSQPSWEKAPAWQQDSAIDGVQYHLDHPNAKAEDSHNNWLKEKQDHGWSYGPIKDPILKQHPCFVPHDQLPIEQQFKDYFFIAIVNSLRGAIDE